MLSELFSLYLENNAEPKGHLKYFAGMLNSKLLVDLIAFQEYTSKKRISKHTWEEVCSKGEAFEQAHNLTYMGELLERFDERNFIENNNNVDLFTLVFAAASILSLSGIEHNTNQLLIFENKILNRLEKEYDHYTALALLSLRLISKNSDAPLLNKYMQLLKKVIDGIVENSSNLYDVLFATEVLLPEMKHIKSIDTQHVKTEVLIPLRKAFEISVVKTLKGYHFDENDAEVLKYLVDVHSLLTTPKADDFDTKYFAAFLQSMHNLQLKEITDGEVQKIHRFLNISEEQIHFLNYYMASFKNDLYRLDKKISVPGYERIANKMSKGYLSKNILLKEIVLKCLLNEEDSVKGILCSYIGLIDLSGNKENFKILAGEITRLERWSHFWKISDHHKYILDDEVLYRMLPITVFTKLVMHFIAGSSSQNEFINLIELAENNGVHLTNYTVFRKSIEFSLYDISNYAEVNNEDDVLLDNLFTYLSEKSIQEGLEYCFSFLDAVGMYKVNSRIYDYMYKCFKENDKLSNPETVKKLFEIHNELLFIKEPSKYPEYIYNNLMSETYSQVTEILPAEKEHILMNLNSSGLLSGDIADNLRLMFLSDEQIRQEAISKHVKEIENEYRLSGVSYKIVDEFINEPEVIETVVQRIKGIFRSEDLPYAIRILKKLANKNAISAKDVFDCVMSISA